MPIQLAPGSGGPRRGKVDKTALNATPSRAGEGLRTNHREGKERGPLGVHPGPLRGPRGRPRPPPAEPRPGSSPESGPACRGGSWPRHFTGLPPEQLGDRRAVLPLGGRAERRGRREPSPQPAELGDAGREGQVLRCCPWSSLWGGRRRGARCDGPRYLRSPLVPTFCSEGPLAQGAGPRLSGHSAPG